MINSLKNYNQCLSHNELSESQFWHVNVADYNVLIKNRGVVVDLDI